MKNFAYPAKIVRTKAGVFEVQFLDLDEAFTEGDTFEKAQGNASEVLSGVILTRLAHDMDIPAPRVAKGKDIFSVLPDAKTQSSLAIRAAFEGRSVAQIARALETSWPAVNRLRDPGHWPTLKLLDRALRAAGKELVIGVRNRELTQDAVLKAARKAKGKVVKWGPARGKEVW